MTRNSAWSSKTIAGLERFALEGLCAPAEPCAGSLDLSCLDARRDGALDGEPGGVDHERSGQTARRLGQNGEARHGLMMSVTEEIAPERRQHKVGDWAAHAAIPLRSLDPAEKPQRSPSSDAPPRQKAGEADAVSCDSPRSLRYTLRQLEYFIAAAETGSITAASERVHISQPSISTAIAYLEKDLGVQLFIRRHAQGLSLTPAGRAILREAKNLFSQARGLYMLASETSGNVRGPLSVGCMVTLAPMLAPELLHSFRVAYPTAQLKHMEGNQEELFSLLRRSEIDIALTYDLQLPQDVAFKPLAALPPHVLLSTDHPLAGRCQVSLRELVDEPMVLLDLPLSREYFLALFLKEGLMPNIVARSAHQEVVRTMVASGYGYSLFNVRPKSDQALDGRKLARVRLAGDHPSMMIGTATLRSLPKSRLIQVFEAHCRSLVSQAHIHGMASPDDEAGLYVI